MRSSCGSHHLLTGRSHVSAVRSDALGAGDDLASLSVANADDAGWPRGEALADGIRSDDRREAISLATHQLCCAEPRPPDERDTSGTASRSAAVARPTRSASTPCDSANAAKLAIDRHHANTLASA
jgi:hypothetical protein